MGSSPGLKSAAKLKTYLIEFFGSPQTPDKSGLPAAVRGAGAVRFGLPSAVRGTGSTGTCCHWAAIGQHIPRHRTEVVRMLRAFTDSTSRIALRLMETLSPKPWRFIALPERAS